MKKKFGFIGAGNMGGAIAQAVCARAGASGVVIFDPNEEKTAALSAKTCCAVAQSPRELTRECDFIFLCVKPNMIEGVLEEISAELEGLSQAGRARIIVSIAAGISITAISDILERRALRLPIIRLMPNLPLSVGKGMTVMSACPGVSGKDKDILINALSAGGRVMELEEKYIDAATPVFSGAPAFTYMFIDAIADGGVRSGLPRDVALALASQAVLGAAAMVQETGRHPGALKDEVCSPGGSTIVGVQALEESGFRGGVSRAVYEAYLRTTQLGEG